MKTIFDSDVQYLWLGGIIVLLVCLVLVLALLIMLLNRSRRTERLALEAKIREQTLLADNEMLDRLNRTKLEFFQNLNHDLKTPLTVISTSVLNAADMLDFEIDREEMRECLGNAQHEIMRMARMVESAMKYSSLHDNRHDMGPVDIAQLLHEGAETYRALLERYGNDLVLDVPMTLPGVFGNADILLHVMSNLLSNANRHTRNGEVLIDARCVASSTRPDVLVTVRDNGDGVKAELLPYVFNRGVSDGGTGLGLSICKTAIEAHGGAIGIESERGKGTAVWFTIPIIERRGNQDAGNGSEDRRHLDS